MSFIIYSLLIIVGCAASAQNDFRFDNAHFTNSSVMNFGNSLPAAVTPPPASTSNNGENIKFPNPDDKQTGQTRPLYISGHAFSHSRYNNFGVWHQNNQKDDTNDNNADSNFDYDGNFEATSNSYRNNPSTTKMTTKSAW